MRLTIDKLRMWFLAAALAVVCVLVLFVGYARYRVQRAVQDLPRRLGIDIQQQTNEFTYSQSVQGKTIFTIHAAKAIQMKAGGKVKLHDVSIIVYGRKADRADRIYGSEFEYDPTNQVATAQGEVHMDLQAPSASVAPAGNVKSGKVEEHRNAATGTTHEGAVEAKGPGVIHVKTSGLVFMEKLAVAATSEPIEFQFAGVTGHATGAEYDSDQGQITLQSAVNITTVMQGRPVVVNATHALLTRDTNLAVLTNATYRSLGQTGRADTATVYLRKDGTAERVEANGNVKLASAGGGTVSAPRANLALNELNRPVSMDMLGGVHYASTAAPGEAASGNTAASRQADGDAGEAHAEFDRASRLRVVHLVHAVRMAEQEPPVALGNGTSISQRDLTADKVDVEFAADAAGRAQAQQMRAFGAGGVPAQMVLTTFRLQDSPASAGAKMGTSFHGGTVRTGTEGRAPGQLALQKQTVQRTVVSADELESQLGAAVRATGHATDRTTGRAADHALQFTRIQGTGHTIVVQQADDGTVQTSSGDRLDIALRNTAGAGGKPAQQGPVHGKQPGPKQRGDASAAGMASGGNAGGAQATNQAGAMQIDTAVQQGHVRIVRTVQPKPGRPATSPATNGASLPPAGAGSNSTTATAERAEYHGDTSLLVLTGNPQVADGTMAMQATKISLAQSTGDATADGDVKGSFQQSAAGGQQMAQSTAQSANQEPVHVIAARAQLVHAENRAIFYGSKGHAARLWQGASQVEAPVLDFQRTQQTLTARGDTGSTQAAVHAVFLSAATQPGTRMGPKAVAPKDATQDGQQAATSGKEVATLGTDAARKKAGPAKQGPEVVRVASRQMVYSEAAHRADFSGSVQVESADGRMHANQAAVFLQTASPVAAGSATAATKQPPVESKAEKPGSAGIAVGGIFGGGVREIVAQGQITLDQPGRHGSGEQLVYTAGDGKFILTGTPAAPPRLTDEAKGTVTGASLTFNSTDDSVTVSGAAGPGNITPGSATPGSVTPGSAAKGGRTRTETRVKN